MLRQMIAAPDASRFSARRSMVARRRLSDSVVLIALRDGEMSCVRMSRLKLDGAREPPSAPEAELSLPLRVLDGCAAKVRIWRRLLASGSSFSAATDQSACLRPRHK